MITSRRIKISKGRDGFLGGQPPKGVAPRNPRLNFFATIRTSEQQWLTIFVAEYGALISDLVFGEIIALPPTIELHQHRSIGPRVRKAPFASTLEPHTLKLEPEVADEARSWSKLGGVASGDELDGKQLARTLKAGFAHYLQIGFGGGRDEDMVSGDWPFGDRKISFYRHKTRRSEWRVYWRSV